ncbi:hypothetical protein [Aeromonas caviae]|jgi:Arc/MetJ-type ribon-helix-helix transcriptional regulator|nr:hypothetical protein [Aeromonas caviae]
MTTKKSGRADVRLTPAQQVYLEKQVLDGKAKSISDAVQQLINKAMIGL